MEPEQAQQFFKSLLPDTSNIQEAKKNIQDPLQLYGLATQLLNEQRNQEAVDLYTEALNQNPDNTTLMDGFAEILLQLDMFDEARQVLTRSIQLAPDSGESKYMYMAQLCEGMECVNCFKKGIEIMTKELSLIKQETMNDQDEEDIQNLSQNIAEAYASIAEIYMTDLCFEADAEQKCQENLEAALTFDNNNPIVYSTFGSFKISQQKPEEAIVLLQQSYNLFKFLPFEQQPPFETRHTLAKHFLEVSQAKEAIELWMGLLEEDDTVAEIYNFLGQAWRPIDSNTSLEYLQSALKSLQEFGCEDQQLIEDLNTLISLVEKENNVGTLDLEIYNDDDSDDSEMEQ